MNSDPNLLGAVVVSANFGFYLVSSVFFLRAMAMNNKEHMQLGRAVLATSMTVGALICFLVASFVGGFITSILAAYWIWQWWKHRRKGKWKKAMKLCGEKTKAKVKAMVDSMTPSPIPNASTPVKNMC